MISRLLAVGAAATALVVGGASAASAATLPAPEVADPPATTVSSAAGVGSQVDLSSALAAISSKNGGSTAGASSDCIFYSRGSTVQLYAGGVTAHGWWDNVNCRTSKAVVRVRIQYLNSWGNWKTVGDEGKEKVSAGGGSDHRSTARLGCASSRERQFRSQIDVDLMGIIDDRYKLYTSEQTLNCSW